MGEVCVITGGGSGMGLAAAKNMPKDNIILISGRTEKKLERAAEELHRLGYAAYIKTCDTSDRAGVRQFAEFAVSLGTVKKVINSAGLSPSMAKSETILRVNALGTVYINEEFTKCMDGGVIVDVASNSAYVLPKILIRKKMYALADTDEEAFMRKALRMSSLARGDYQKAGFAYSISKNFTVWYAQKCAFRYGKKGIRVVSLSPGLIATDMGNLEKAEGGSMVADTAEERMGTPEELGYALAVLADERNGYLAGVDILCDGGATTGRYFKKC